MFTNVQNSNLQLDAGSVTSELYKHTVKSADEKKNQQLLQFALRRMMNARCNYDDKTQFRVSLHHLANRNVLK